MGVLTQPLYHTELIDGQELEKPLPKKLHAFIQSYLIILFGNKLPPGYRVASELNVWCGPDRLVPDVTVMLRSAQYRDGDLIDPPLLGVEIFSPGQTVGDLFDKCNRLVKAGTRSCWVIWPERRKAWTYTLDDLVEETQALSIRFSEALENQPVELTVPLASLWSELED